MFAHFETSHLEKTDTGSKSDDEEHEQRSGAAHTTKQVKTQVQQYSQREESSKGTDPRKLQRKKIESTSQVNIAKKKNNVIELSQMQSKDQL